jgi:hypothetical protein
MYKHAVGSRRYPEHGESQKVVCGPTPTTFRQWAKTVLKPDVLGCRKSHSAQAGSYKP